MRRLKLTEIPILPLVALVDDENVAFGSGEPGIIIQYMDRDKCILVEWEDVVRFGVELLKAGEKPTSSTEEISAPTEARN